MALSENTNNFLKEMARTGVDPTIISALERDLDGKPDANKAVDNSILAQASFNSYRSKKDNEIAELKKKVEQTASLSTAANNLTGDLKEAALKQIRENKDWFEANGYDIEGIEKLAEDMAAQGIPFTMQKATQVINDKEKEKDNVMPNEKDFVDNDTLVRVLTTTGTNMASGNLNMSIQVTRALNEANKLGIVPTDEQWDTFHAAMIKGFEQRKEPTEIINEHFGFSAKRAEIADNTRKAELVAAETKGRQEALKEAGVTIRDTNSGRPRHLIFDRSTPMRKAIETDRREQIEKDNQIKLEDLPKNKLGDPEYFRLRGSDNDRRERHLSHASERFAQASEEFSPDGEYIGHRKSA